MKISCLTLFGLIAGLRLASAQAPSITSSPNNQTVYTGGGVSFQVAASGSPLYYFWQLNGVALTNSARISGANGAVLTITKAGAGDAGQYSCIVSNSGGAPSSASASLTVNPVPPGLLYAETFPTPEVPAGTGFYPISTVVGIPSAGEDMDGDFGPMAAAHLRHGFIAAAPAAPRSTPPLRQTPVFPVCRSRALTWPPAPA